MKTFKNYLPYIAGVLVSTIFGFSFVFTKKSLELMSPLQILAFRFTAAALLLTVLKMGGVLKINIKGKNIRGLLTLALFQPVIYFIFETVGVNLTSSSEAGMMIALIPVVVTIFAALFLKEKPSTLQGMFILTSVSGVMFIIIFSGISDIGSSYYGLAALMGAVLTAGVYNIQSRKMSAHSRPAEITYIMMWVGAFVFNLLGVLKEFIFGSIHNYIAPLFIFDSWIAIIYLGVFSSVGAFFMMNYMLSKMPAPQSAVFSNITTIISILAGILVRGESFYWFQVIGGFMILLGVWGTNYFSMKPSMASNSNRVIENA